MFDDVAKLVQQPYTPPSGGITLNVTDSNLGSINIFSQQVNQDGIVNVNSGGDVNIAGDVAGRDILAKGEGAE